MLLHCCSSRSKKIQVIISHGRCHHERHFHDLDLISFYSSSEQRTNLRQTYLDFLDSSKRLQHLKKYFLLYEMIDIVLCRPPSAIPNQVLLQISIFLNEYSIEKYMNLTSLSLPPHVLHHLKAFKSLKQIDVATKIHVLETCKELQSILQDSVDSFQQSHQFLDYYICREQEGATPPHKKIILATTNIFFAKIIMKLLFSHGFSTTHVTSDTDLISELQKVVVDVVLIDEDLPGTDALSVLKEFFRLEKRIKTELPRYARPVCLCLISEEDPELRDAAAAVGFVGTLNIPFRYAQFEQLVGTSKRSGSMREGIATVGSRVVKHLSMSYRVRAMSTDEVHPVDHGVVPS